MSYTISKQRKSNENHDSSLVCSNQYNNASGAQKNISGGVFLKSIQTGVATWTLDATTARLVGRGVTMAIYNNDGAIHAVVIGDSSIAAPTPGVADASGRPGIALMPNSWTYINTYDQQYIRTDNNKVYCYILEDSTYLQ